MSGAIRCWGSGAFGQLGYGNTDSIGDDETPASAGDVPIGVTGNYRLVTGAFHSCVGVNFETLRCWSYNAFGQLGQGHTDNIRDDEPASTGVDVIVLP